MGAGYTQDALEGMASDPTPKRVDEREAIAHAVTAAASERHGLVHITAVRRHLPDGVAPQYLGSSINRLARRGVLTKTPRYEPNGNTRTRNGNKPSPVWRLERPITPKDYR